MIREEMMERMSREEFLGWIAYSEIEPFGDEREDLRAGILWSLLGMVNSDKRSHDRFGLDKYPLIQMRERMNGSQNRRMTSMDFFAKLKGLPKAKPS
jgi:hypothetical protein